MATFPLAAALLIPWLGLSPAVPQSQPAESDEAEVEVLEEITVTAQKREDLLQQVPVSVTALTGDRLGEAGLRTTSDVDTQVPNLEIKSNFRASNPTISLRGVGLNDHNANANGGVSLYSDEIYLSAPSSQVLALFDLERVEVLRGPQGTLYGKNTTGGAIKLITNKPSGVRGGHGRLILGRFDEVDFDGALDVPLGSGGNAFRFAGATYNRDGYTRNLFNGGDENDVDLSAARAQLRLAPGDAATVLFNVHGSANRSGMQQFKNRGLINGADALGYVDDPDPFAGSYDRDTREEVDVFGTSVTFDRYRPGFTVTSITGYEQAERLALEDTDASPNRFAAIDWSDESRQVSQEVQVASAAGERFDWIAGAYLFQGDLEAANLFDLLALLRDMGVPFDPVRGPFRLLQAYDQETRSAAPFGQVTARLSERLTARVGLRYTWESKEFDLRTSFEEGVSIPVIDFQDEVSSSEISGEIGLSWQAKDDLLLFATLSRGFKGGGFNGGALFFQEEARRIDPEFLDAVEIGVKSSWLRNRLRLNSAAFYYDYQDLQVFHLINPGGVPIQVLDNASDARVLGLEAELEARPVSPLSFSLNVGLLDAEYRDFVLFDGTDFSGNPLVSAPDWNVNGRLSYVWPVGPGWLGAHLGYSRRDEMFFDPSHRSEVGTEGYGLLDARLSFDLSSRGYALALWGKNLTDEVYLSEVFDNSAFGSHKLAYGEPRTYGLELVYRF